MPHRSATSRLFPLLLLIPVLAPMEATAVVMSGPGWECRKVGIGVAGNPHNWTLYCTPTDARPDGGGGRNESGGDRLDWRGGGGGVRQNGTAGEQETDDRLNATSCGETAGNPVVLYTGNKVEFEVDFQALGEMPLGLRRTYNRMWYGTGLFGKHWLSNFDYTLVFAKGAAWAQRPDGRRLKYVFDAQAQRWLPEAGGVGYVVRNADGGHTLFNDEGGTERYDADGFVQQRVDAHGIQWTFTYAHKRLRQVTHSSGRSVRFQWSDNQLTQVIDPAGNVYAYTYVPNAFGTGRPRLSSATLPGSPATTVHYHYEDARHAGALTGKSFNGARFSTFAYDDQGRATLTQHAGGANRHTFAYTVAASEQVAVPPPPVPPGEAVDADGTAWYCENVACVAPFTVDGVSTKSRATRFQVVETNPLGRKTTHEYVDGKKTSVVGDASPHCPASNRTLTYDANGFEDIVSDFTGRVTDFDHDAAGRLIRRTEAVGTPVQRVRTFSWDTERNRLMATELVGVDRTTYTYAPSGRVASVTTADTRTGQTRTTTYAHTTHASGLLSSTTIDGPAGGDVVVHTYSAAGDLLQTSNAAGQATRYAGHDALGRPSRVTSPAGAVTEYEYDARGRITIARTFPNGTQPAETRFVYGASGLLEAVQAADGGTVLYHYDAVRRVVQEDIAEPGGTFAVRRITYNAMSQPTKVEIGRDP